MSALQELTDALRAAVALGARIDEPSMLLAVAEHALAERAAADEQVQALVLAEMGAVMVAMEASGVSADAVRATARSKLSEGGCPASSLLEERVELRARVVLADEAAVAAARLAVDWRSEAIAWLREHEDAIEEIGVTCDCGGWNTTTLGVSVDSLCAALGEEPR